MLKLNRILVTTDFSPVSQNAYPFAVELTKKYGGKVDMLHVIPVFKYLNESVSRLGLPFDMDKDVYPHLITESEERLVKEMNQFVPEDIRGRTLARVELKASECIIREAAESNADLIVMGSTGAGGRDILWGSTTEKVVRNSKIPVLAIPSGFVPKEINNILVPTDYSELSFNSLRGAASLASSLLAEITLFHVVELYGSLSENEAREAGKSELDSIKDKLLKRVDMWMQKFPEFSLSLNHSENGLFLISKRGGTEKSVKFNIVVTKGISAHYEIADYASEHADMIVLTTHGRSGLSHMFLGSTTEKVVQATNKPTLTWRP
jgi:nucleotide-binding universal stress UspA family protein